MKPFNLKTYLENPSRKVITRDGRPVRIVSTNANLFSPGPDATKYPVVALIKVSSANRGKRPNEEILNCYNADGNIIPGRNDRSDLFFETVKVSGWINIYTSKFMTGQTITGSICKTKDEALSIAAGKDNYLDTIYIEWEE